MSGRAVVGSRPGEELDVAALHEWLVSQLGPLTGPPEVHQYTHGASNWTYRLRYPERDLVLRRPPKGTKAKSAHNMAREYDVQKLLKPVFGKIPEMLALCRDHAVIGDEFYVMEYLEGIVPGTRLPPGVRLTPEQARTLCERTIDTLVQLHQVDYRRAGLDRIAPGAGYARRQIEGWNERFARARTWNVFRARDVMRWLEQNIPQNERLCVVHNDYRLDNLVLKQDDPTEIIGVLDWELATIGDPLMDLGNSMAYWIHADDDFMARSTRRQPTHLPGMLTREQFVQRYAEQSGISIENWSFYAAYGYFRLAGIVQQIYYRYHHKQTRNPAFKRFWLFANYLVWRARKVIRNS